MKPNGRNSTVNYLAFDIESVADRHLVSKIRYPGENLGPEAAIGGIARN